MILRIFRPGAFLLAILCFTLPFIKISCNSQEVETAKGYYMAFGHTKASDTTAKPKPDKAAAPAVNGDNSDFKLQPLMLSAFIALAMGFLISFSSFRYSRFLLAVLALTAIGLFVYYYLDYKNQLDINMSPTDKMAKQMHITVDFLYGYWLALGFSVLAAILALLPQKRKLNTENGFEGMDIPLET